MNRGSGPGTASAFARPDRLERVTDPGALRLVEGLRAAVGPNQIRVVLMFGSRLLAASPDRFSAYDLVVVTERYRSFYEALARAGLSKRAPALQTALNHVLGPNVIAVAPDGWDNGPVAKVMVIEPEAFTHALGKSAPDHYVKGRLVQRVGLLHARDADSVAWVDQLLEGARADVPRWVGPFLEQPFSAERAAWRMLALSYAGELRPEAEDRVREVFAAQRIFLVTALTRALEEAAEAGRLIRIGSPDAPNWTYRFPRPRGALHRLAVRIYFLRSKARATARWFKHVLTFDNWLDYIAHKVRRRTGMDVEITPWERRLPYLLLWPKVFRVLRHRPDALGSAREGLRGPEDVARPGRDRMEGDGRA